MNISNNKKVYIDETAVAMMNTFAELCGLYTVFVDADGKVVTQPSGPDTNIGEFFDLFEQPAYKNYYKDIQIKILEEDESTLFSREEGGAGKLNFAPVMYGDDFLGMWILASYTEKEDETLEAVMEKHLLTAEHISYYLRTHSTVKAETKKVKLLEAELQKQIKKNDLINKVIQVAVAKEEDFNLEEALSELVPGIAEIIDIDKVLIYSFPEINPSDYKLVYSWNKNETDATYTAARRWNGENFGDVKRQLVKKGSADFNPESSDLKIKEEMRKFDIKSMIVHPLYSHAKLYGFILFADSKLSRAWEDSEIKFTSGAALAIQDMIQKAENDDVLIKMNKQMAEIYHNFDECIFIRDAYTGEVLFANKAINEMMGRDFTGGDSREILTDLRDKFDNVGGMRKSFITKNKMASWRSYIQRFDTIMDVITMQVSWITGEPATLIILKKAENS